MQLKPCHHNLDTIKRIYTPRCFYKKTESLLVETCGWRIEINFSSNISSFGVGLMTTFNLHSPALTQASCRQAIVLPFLENFLLICWRPDTDNGFVFAQHQTKTRPVVWVPLCTLLVPTKCVLQTWTERKQDNTASLSAGRQQLQSPDVWDHYDFLGHLIINCPIELVY